MVTADLECPVMPTQQSVFWQTANLQDPVFTADLKKAAPGSYDFGFIDNSKYTGSIAYTPVDNSQGVWGFTADSYSIGSSSQKLRARQDGGDGSDGGSITGIAGGSFSYGGATQRLTLL